MKVLTVTFDPFNVLVVWKYLFKENELSFID